MFEGDGIKFTPWNCAFPPELNLEGCCIQERDNHLVVITYNEITGAKEIWIYSFDAENLDGIWRKDGNRDKQNHHPN